MAAASTVAHQIICWPQVYKHKPRTYCVVCGKYTNPGRAGKKLYKCVKQECKNHIHAQCNAGNISFDCTLTNLALLRKLEGSVKEKITFQPNNTDLENKTFGDKGYINGFDSERHNLIKTGEILAIELTIVRENNIDNNNNKISIEYPQHRKEHKRKPHNTANYVNMYLINGKPTDVDISSVKCDESQMEEREEYKYLDTQTNQHRKEHKRIYIGENEIIEINETKDMVDINSKEDQRYENIGTFSEDDEIAETDFDENYIELLDQIYFKGHITQRNRKKYLRKWRTHKRKRKRIFKKVKHNPNVNSIIKVDEVEEALTDYLIEKCSINPHDQDHGNDQTIRYADKYNELYDEYNHSSNKPEEDQHFINLIRDNNQRNLHPYELPQIIYIIDNTDPDEYKPPNHYFDDEDE